MTAFSMSAKPMVGDSSGSRREQNRAPVAMKFTSLLVFLGCGTLVGCAWLGPKKKTATKNPVPQAKLVGRIASIPADRRFVLIQSYGKWTVATGSVLVAHGPDERTANLLTTGEALGQFAAADLQSGILDVGDAVFLPAAPKSSSPAAKPAQQALDQPTSPAPKSAQLPLSPPPAALRAPAVAPKIP